MVIVRNGEQFELTEDELAKAWDEYRRRNVYDDLRDELEVADYIDDFLKKEHIDKWELLEEMESEYFFFEDTYGFPHSVEDVVASVLESYGYDEYLELREALDEID